MKALNALGWEPPEHWRRLDVIESHTGGEPFRVFLSGVDEVPGETMEERRRHAMEHLDWLRRATILEPRGHADMYGGWIGPPVSRDGDISVLFVHNEGFSTMCGHGIIALAKVVHDTGIIPADGDEATLRVDTPAGRVVALSRLTGGRVVETRFRNVPSFVATTGHAVEVPGWGRVSCDVAYGGAFYAFVDAEEIGVDIADLPSAIAAGRAIKRAVTALGEPSHPEEAGLGFLYGVIFTSPSHRPDVHSKHLCIFADGEVDRSPTGTGVSARLALLHHRGETGVGEELTFESITGSRFVGRVVETIDHHGITAVIPEVGGSAAITGRSQLWIDPDDTLGAGFLLR